MKEPIEMKASAEWFWRIVSSGIWNNGEEIPEETPLQEGNYIWFLYLFDNVTILMSSNSLFLGVTPDSRFLGEPGFQSQE
jgi:hypothetical protein